MTTKQLIEHAMRARNNAYTPYSNFKVGAALLTKSGKVYLGANVENCAYGPSNCAERSAIFSAISNGEREFEKLAVVGNEIITPCGVCRQVISELLPNAEIICAKDPEHFKVFSMEELLPYSFNSTDLKNK